CTNGERRQVEPGTMPGLPRGPESPVVTADSRAQRWTFRPHPAAGHSSEDAMPARTTRLAWASTLLVTLTVTASLAACTGTSQSPPPHDGPASPTGPAAIQPPPSPTGAA